MCNLPVSPWSPLQYDLIRQRYCTQTCLLRIVVLGTMGQPPDFHQAEVSIQVRDKGNAGSTNFQEQARGIMADRCLERGLAEH